MSLLSVSLHKTTPFRIVDDMNNLCIVDSFDLEPFLVGQPRLLSQ